MVRGSIRWRLSAVAAVAIAGVLILSAIGLTILFDRQVTRLAKLELEARSTLLVAALDQNNLLGTPPSGVGGDPRYLQPYSGLYWQIEVAGRTYRSQSLWDTVLAVDHANPMQGDTLFYEADGPDGQALLILDRSFTIGSQALPLRVSLAENLAELEEAEALFQKDLLPFLVGLGLIMTLGSLVQVAIGLRPFIRVQQHVNEVVTGQRPRLGPDQPEEVRPLAVAIDGLLEDRDTRIARARRRATDLAHTLKTPLQALLGETGRLRDRGERVAADTIDEIVETVRVRVDRELSRARIGGGGTANASGAALKVANVLSRMTNADRISLYVDAPPTAVAQIDESDLIEALGSIAENALRHAKSKVTITVHDEQTLIKAAIEDDGPGVPQAELARIKGRGVRLDESLEGSGLGLSIAHEIIEAAGGTVVVENLSPGFRVTVILRAG